MTIDNQGPGWTDIESIEFKFATHCTHKDVHKYMTESLGDHLDTAEIDELFETSERLVLKKNAIEILRGTIDTYITVNARSTKDLTRIPVITRDLPLTTETIRHERGRTTTTTTKITSTKRLLQALKEVRENEESKLVLRFITHTLQFYEGKEFNPANFAHIGNEDNPPTVHTPEKGEELKSENNKDILNAILTGNATLAKTLDTLVNNNASTSTPKNTSPPQTTRVASEIDLELFNTNSLPPDVRDRYNLAKRGERMLTKDDMKPFVTTTPNLKLDSTGNTMRTCLYHHTYPGNRIILRDGTIFRLNTSTTIDKRFTTKAPKLPRGKITQANIRFWYKLLLEHCQNFGVFLCPYYCFRKNVGDLKGFVCGEDTDEDQFDLPSRYAYEIPKWTGLVGQAIKEAFPEGSTQRGICETNETDGYKALKRILREKHPTFIEYGEILAIDHPIQDKDVDIHEYYDIYVDYLEMRAFTEGIPTSLHDYNQMTKFIVSCKWGYHLLNMETVRNERKSSEPTVRDRYSPTEIALTIQDLLAFVDTDRLPPFENMRKVRKISSPTGSPAKSTQGYQPNRPRSRMEPRKKDARRSPTKQGKNKTINALEMEREVLQLEAGLERLQINDEGPERFAAGIYRLGINAVKATGTFDTSQSCLVCSAKGHAFEDCPVLNNHDLLKDIHIAFCACCKRIQRKAEQANQPIFQLNSNEEEYSDEEFEYQHFSGYEESDFTMGKGPRVEEKAKKDPTQNLEESSKDLGIDGDPPSEEPPEEFSEGYPEGLPESFSEGLPESFSEGLKDNRSYEDTEELATDLTAIRAVRMEVGEGMPRTHCREVLKEGESIYEDHSDDMETELDPDAVRAQIDTGARVSVTNLKDALFKYQEYEGTNRCPITLTGAINGGGKIVPLGHGFIRIPGNLNGGYIDVHTYYSPEIASTLISENCILKGAVKNRDLKNYSGQDLIKRFDPEDGSKGSLKIVSRHKSNSAKDVVIPGVIINGQCYSLPIIMPHDMNLHSVKVGEVMDMLEGPANEPIELPLQLIRARTEKLLWHQRLGHPCDEYLYNAHKYIQGVPKFNRETSVLDICPTCTQAKQSKEAPGNKTTKVATKPFEGLSVDFSFSGVKSDNEERRIDYEGFNGETCYILITDHFTGMKYGSTRLSKAPPIKWLHRFLGKHNLTSKDKYVVLDQGGELYNNPDVVNVFTHYGYEIRPTGADTSRQNGPVERAHRSVSNVIRSLLSGADLDMRFWPYAFDHAIRIWNSIPMKGKTKSPYEQLNGRKPDFRKLRTFGCRVWVRPPQGRQAKFIPNSRKGLFLGYTPGNTTNLIWYDPETNRVKIATHARFDEGMNDLPIDEIPPNVQHLQRSDDGARPEESISHSTRFNPVITFSAQPFAATTKATLQTNPSRPHGLVLNCDELSKRPYISNILPKSAAASLHSTLRAARNKLRGAYLISINDNLVFTMDDVHKILDKLRDQGVENFQIEYAPVPKLTAHRRKQAKNQYNELHKNTGLTKHTKRASATREDTNSDMNTHERTQVNKPQQKADIHLGKRVAKIFDGRVYYGTVVEHWKEKDKKLWWHIRYDDGDEEDLDRKQLKTAIKLRNENKRSDPTRGVRPSSINSLQALEDMVNFLPTIDMETLRAMTKIRTEDNTEIRSEDIDNTPLDLINTVINAIGSSATTEEEQALGYFTRRKLKTLSTWPLWLAGERKQLNQFEALGMYGDPILLNDTKNHIILRPHWQYNIKRDGTRRSRLCCNGSKRAAPLLHALAMTYSSCVEHPIQRLFLGIAAKLNLLLFGGDAKDAYGHSPGPEHPTYMKIDDAYAEWYKEKYGKDLDRGMVLPVMKALQGHPESGRLWEKHISTILRKLGFESTTHDKTIYRKNAKEIDGEGDWIYMLRQVDDFAIACKEEQTAIDIYSAIGRELQTENEEEPPFAYLGLIKDFNGVDISQTNEYIEVSCSNYIDRVLRSHGWETEAKGKGAIDSPLPKECLEQIYRQEGPKEGTEEHALLEAKHKFGYRNLLGELMFCYVSCRCDIGYAVTLLSKFSTCPSDYHYSSLKKVAKYLRNTKKWGIRFKRSVVRNDLQSGDFNDVPVTEEGLPEYPDGTDRGNLVCFVDAAYGNDYKKRRSTTGFAVTYSGGAVVYQSKTQTVTALSSTEAELIAAVTAAKAIRFVRSVLSELGLGELKPTPMYEDNRPTIDIVNSGKPTQRSRHIDIRFFAIQDWRQEGDIVLIHIAGVINPADDLTKPLGWVLHNRHCRYMMGHCHYRNYRKLKPSVTIQGLRLGKGSPSTGKSHK